eukprot:8600590-Pyramimonas_sp.AAC.1
MCTGAELNPKQSGLLRGASVTGAGGGVLEMCANQGNWRPLLVLLQASPALRTQDTLSRLFREMVNSSCYPCMAGTGPTCMRYAVRPPSRPPLDPVGNRGPLIGF